MDAHWYNFERLPQNDYRCKATKPSHQSVHIMAYAIGHLRVAIPTQMVFNPYWQVIGKSWKSHP